ncbi:MAG: hypothetical protein CMJ76_07440 [Planctomycetaceae bacterium]|nr:hypothetical protein [Planctomycetaceae bacterium]
MRFRSSKELAEQEQSKAPPNYFSRRAQYKLFVLVALLMGVVLAIEKVADPNTFSFFSSSEPLVNQSEANTTDAKPKDTFQYPGLAHYGTFNTGELSQTELDVHQTYLDLWKVIFKRLTYNQKKLVVDTLRKARQKTLLNDEHKTTWWDLYQEIDELFQKYVQQVLLSLNASENAFTDSQKARGMAVVATLRQQWNDRHRKAFLEVLEQPANTAQFEQEYRFTQSIIDQLSVSMLEDHSIFSINDDLAWFRMLEQLQQYRYPVIRQHSTARVSALELGTQQSQFRGRLITVRGEIRRAYRVQAQDNELNLKQYNVIIIKPTGGTLVPFVVYSLETPKNFPRLPDKNLDGELLDIGDVVEVTGYFFKSWAHPGDDGKMHSSPLLLAKNFDWFKGERLEATASQKRADDSLSGWVIITIPFTLAILITVGVYIASIWNNDDSRKRSVRNTTENQMSHLNEDEVGPSVLEALGELALQEIPVLKKNNSTDSVLSNKKDLTSASVKAEDKFETEPSEDD